MGKAAKPVVVTEAVDEGEVPSSQFAKATEKGLTNGLGLEHLFPNASKAAKAAAVELDEADEVDAEAGEPKKVTPPKDPKTGRFLKTKPAESEPPIEDAQPNDDQDTLKKRLKDTRDWASQVNKRNQELDLQLKKLEKDHKTLADKLNGVAPDNEQTQEADNVAMARLNERALTI